jgi:hypothetical protein
VMRQKTCSSPPRCRARRPSVRSGRRFRSNALGPDPLAHGSGGGCRRWTKMPKSRFPRTFVTGYRRASSAPVGEEISSPSMGYRGVRDAGSTPGLLGIGGEPVGNPHSRHLGE